MICKKYINRISSLSMVKNLAGLLIILLIGSGFKANADHFSPVWGDQNPQNWMNIIVTSAAIDGLSVEAGDEIAAFDISPTTGEEICVGYVVLTGSSAPYALSAGKDAGSGGFTSDNPIFFRLWDASTSTEITIAATLFNLTPPLVDVYTANGIASVAIVGHSVSIWDGSDSDDWNINANWNTGITPRFNANVIIPASGVSTYPRLTSSSTGVCNNITIEASATAQASILGNQYLTVNGTAQVQSYITADQWHAVSKPVEGLDVGFYSLGGNPTVYLSEYNEANETYEYLINPSTSLNNLQGYFLWVCDTDHTYSYTGDLNTGTFGEADNLTRNNSGSGNEGWNLIGNPYPSTIDWDAAAGWTKSANLGAAIYFYNDGVWEYYLDDSPSGHSNNGSRYIAPGQGFFVRLLNESSGTLIMNEEVRINEQTNFFKSREVGAYLKLTASGNEYHDETIIRFIDGSSDSFDGEYDVFKKFSNNEEHPQIYTSSDENYFINSIPSADELSICFIAGVDGEYTLSISEIENIGDIWVEDIVTGASIDILNNDYSFEYHPGDEPARFIIHFTPVTVNQFENETIRVYSFDNKVCIKTTDTESGHVMIYNILGQEVHSSTLTSTSELVQLNEPGYYIVSIQHNGLNTRKKIFIR